MRKLIVALVGICFFGVPALAQDDGPTWEVFGGYSPRHVDLILLDDNAHGFLTSLTINPFRTKAIGFEGEFGAHFGDAVGVDYKAYTLMAGPKVAGRFDKWTPWGHALFGGHRISGGGADSNDFSMALGGGVDVNASEHVAVRVFQADWLLVRVNEGSLNAHSHNYRFAFGVVLKW
jgi:opacity protein-like surface antigen